MHAFAPFFSHFSSPWVVTILFLILSLPACGIFVLKGFALWHAARGSQKWWFIVLLIINTFGILEIVYLIWFRPKTKSPIVESAPVTISSSAQ